ncbi:hypothetical protein CLOSTASPAR_06243 [[Clostridium] asparagiforme DSM 15981]|uniref:Uncharacterized protein n=1 Tax=[Clostridium] asparagiforme DSM 15981 TaxID=518636 RepID=C0DAE0_9FIRM|nr:hypothetical protein CLOSTASPAR_06243 [[Clostridium] asparagiforme DSM 15981]
MRKNMKKMLFYPVNKWKINKKSPRIVHDTGGFFHVPVIDKKCRWPYNPQGNR